MGVCMRHKSLRLRVYEILNVGESGDRLSRFVDIFLIILILTNVLAVILGTVPSLGQRYGQSFAVFESFSVAVFTIEYLLRIWSSTSDPAYKDSFLGRVRFAMRPSMVIDLLAIAPYYLTFVVVDLRVLRALRLLRILRIVKLGRYSRAMQTLGRVLAQKKEELVVTLSAMIILLVISSSLMYFAEREAQPEVFSSIPAAMWWGVATLTTVGYGDVYPITWLGRVMAAVVAVLGIGMFALPAGILGAGFLEALEATNCEEGACPHCGRPMADEKHED